MAKLGGVSVFCCFMILVSVAIADFDFIGFGNEDENSLILEGDSFLNETTAYLVCPNSVHDSPSYGGIFYNKPYTLFNLDQNTSLSFSTEFICKINIPVFDDKSPMLPNSLGNGFSFLISPTTEITKTTFGLTKSYFSITFDNRMDPADSMPSETYVRVFNDSFFPFITISTDFNLRISHNNLQVKIVYDGKEKTLQLFLCDTDSTLPPSLVLNSTVDLSNYLLKYAGNNMFVGIAAASNTCTETYQIESWNFSLEKAGTSSLKVTFIILVGAIIVALAS